MDKYKISKNGLIFSGLLGFLSLSGGGILSIIGDKTDVRKPTKIEEYYQMEQITNTLNRAVEQSHDINFGSDDLKMREALSGAYEISNRQFEQLAQNEEIKQYIDSVHNPYKNQIKYFSLSGIGLLSLASLGIIGLALYNERTNQIDSKPLNKLLKSLKR